MTFKYFLETNEDIDMTKEQILLVALKLYRETQIEDFNQIFIHFISGDFSSF